MLRLMTHLHAVVLFFPIADHNGMILTVFANPDFILSACLQKTAKINFLLILTSEEFFFRILKSVLLISLCLCTSVLPLFYSNCRLRRECASSYYKDIGIFDK